MVAEKVQQLEEENITLKARIEELQQLFGINPRMPKNCEYCKNFTQYYFKQGKSYYPTCAGHCSRKQGKGKKNRRHMPVLCAKGIWEELYIRWVLPAPMGIRATI